MKATVTGAAAWTTFGGDDGHDDDGKEFVEFVTPATPWAPDVGESRRYIQRLETRLARCRGDGVEAVAAAAAYETDAAAAAASAEASETYTSLSIEREPEDGADDFDHAEPLNGGGAAAYVRQRRLLLRWRVNAALRTLAGLCCCGDDR